MKTPTEQYAVVATLNPDAYTASSRTTDYVNMEFFHQISAILQAGTLGATGTLNAKILQATSSTGAGAVTVAGKAITALTTADNGKLAIINLKTEEMNVVGGFSFAALRVVSVATSDWGAIVLGLNPRYGPASANDLSDVDEIIA